MTNTVLNTTTSINMLAVSMETSITVEFDKIETIAEFDAALDMGSAYVGLNDSIEATARDATYAAIAFAVRIALLVRDNEKFREHFNARAKTLGVSYDGGNVHGLITRAVFGMKVDAKDAEGKAIKKWQPNMTMKNKDRHIRALVDLGIEPAAVPTAIREFEFKVGKSTLKKLDALVAFDQSKYPLTGDTLVNKRWGSKAVREAVQARQAAMPEKLAEAVFNEDGFALFVGRKNADGTVDFLYDAKLSDTTIMQGVRKGYEAA